jgi:FkbM family methyltransferase
MVFPMRRVVTRTVLRLLTWLADRRFARRVAARQHTSGVVRALWSAASRPLRWRPIPILGGPAKGLRINLHGSAVAFATGAAEKPLQDALLCEVHEGATVFDIGANVGFVTLVAARLVGPGGRVVAFEPVPGNADAIRENLALNAIDWVELHETAVGRAGGTAKMIVSDVSAFSRFENINVPTGARGRIDVSVTSIDEFMSLGAAPVPDVVKIDVEGAELDVLEGMRRTIAEHRPVILCEIHDCNVPYVELMRSLGYETVNLDEQGVPVERGHRNAHTLARPIGAPLRSAAPTPCA